MAGAAEPPLRLLLLYGSHRRDRAGIGLARFLLAEARARGAEAELVDAAAEPFPVLDRMYKEMDPAPEPIERVADLIRRADGFVFVAGEYNHGIQPGLKNVIDHFLEEWLHRPSGVACYSAGGFGGVRAAMQLRMTLAEIGTVTIPSLLPVPKVSDAIAVDGTPKDDAWPRRAGRFLDELAWYARALRAARAEGPPG